MFSLRSIFKPSTVIFAALCCWCSLVVSRADLAQRHGDKISWQSSPSKKANVNEVGPSACRRAYKDLGTEELSRLIDASGKPGSGIFEGNTFWFGSFSECKKQRDARYCLTSFAGAIGLEDNKSQVKNFMWGACVPSPCEKQDLTNGLEFFLNNISDIQLRPLGNHVTVECAEDPEYTAGVILTIFFFGMLLGLCLLATVLEMLKSCQKMEDETSLEKSNNFSMDKEANEKTPLVPNGSSPATEVKLTKTSYLYEIINCFSITRNVNIVMTTKVGKTDLTYLHGIRVLSMFWIIYLHVASQFALKPITENLNDAVDFLKRGAGIVFYSGQLAVDTFFVLSGLLVVYVTLNNRERTDGKTNWFKFYFHRFWRLTPSYMLAILFVAKLRPFLGDGPLWYLARDTSHCSDNWWINLLYVNNVVRLDHLCLGQTWYLANDMQFFIISPLLIIIGLRFGLRSLAAVSSFIIIASVITTASIIAANDLEPTYAYSDLSMSAEELEKTDDQFHDIYTTPYCRIQTYIVGALLGYFLWKFLSRRFKLKWYGVITLWIMAIAVQLTVVCAPYSAWKDDPRVWSKGENILYGSLHRLAWGLTVAWVIFACHYGYAGPIKAMLAAKPWITLSRINYATFILHLDMIKVILFNIERPVHYTGFTQVTYFFASLVLSYACAFIWTVIVELPCSNLESLAWSKTTKERKNEKRGA